jgi:hypothetical protein
VGGGGVGRGEGGGGRGGGFPRLQLVVQFGTISLALTTKTVQLDLPAKRSLSEGISSFFVNEIYGRVGRASCCLGFDPSILTVSVKSEGRQMKHC